MLKTWTLLLLLKRKWPGLWPCLHEDKRPSLEMKNKKFRYTLYLILLAGTGSIFFAPFLVPPQMKTPTRRAGGKQQVQLPGYLQDRMLHPACLFLQQCNRWCKTTTCSAAHCHPLVAMQCEILQRLCPVCPLTCPTATAAAAAAALAGTQVAPPCVSMEQGPDLNLQAALPLPPLCTREHHLATVTSTSGLRA